MTRFRQRPGRAPRTAIFLFLLFATTGSRLQGQDSTRVSATMLRVLAEAADGERSGRAVYFVADHRFPHKVLGPFFSLDEAQRVQADSGATFGVFGPYTTPPGPASDAGSRIEKIRVTMVTPRGRQTFDVDLGKVDALFLSRSSIEKFVIPYYGRVYGPEYAQWLEDRLGKVGIILCHIRPSYLCVPRPGVLNPLDVMEPGTPLNR